MAHQTLYRTFRPKKFSDVSGQPQVTNVLERQIEKGTPAHAYLFCGTRGTGKTTTARILANALNCESPVNGNPCGKCDVCRSFEQESFVDVLEIDAASNNGVDNIRDIRDKAALLPVVGKYKVYIIDEVHMLSTGAFNALLKTLEEPPPHAVFILATTEFRKIPKTITSRCQHYDFRRIGEADIIARLRYIAESINIEYEPAALELLAAQSEGALRDALSLMDQCISGGTLTKQDVRETLGISDDELLAAMCDSMLAEDAEGVLRAADQLADGGTTPAHILGDTITELSERLAKSAANAESAKVLLRSLEILIGAQGTLRYSPAPGAVLTAALVRATIAATDTDTRNLELRVRRLEERMEQVAAGGPIRQQPQAPQNTPQPAQRPQEPAQGPRDEAAPVRRPSFDRGLEMQQPAPPAAHKADNEQLLRRLQDALRSISGAHEPSALAMQELVVSKNEVVAKVLPQDEVIVEMLLMDGSSEDLQQALEEVFGKPAPRFRIETIKPGGSRRRDSDGERQGAVVSMLEDLFGEENVEITSLGD